MALSYSTLTRPANPQVVDPSTGRMRDEWQLYFDRLTTRLNATVGVDTPATDAEYLVGAADATLTAERVVTDTATIAWDLGTAAQAKATRAALTGDVTAGADSNATTIPNDVVTYAKMQNVSATSRIIGRKTAGSGDPEECTLSEALDFIGSAAQGDILYRGASSWARLAAGTSGQFLKTNGAAANPQWATAGWQLIEQNSASGVASFSFSIAGFDEVEAWVYMSPANDGVRPQMQLNQGAGFLTGSTDYKWGNMSGDSRSESAAAGTNLIEMQGTTNTQGNVSTEGFDMRLNFRRPNASGINKTVQIIGNYGLTSGLLFTVNGAGMLRSNTNAITAVKCFYSTGNVATAVWSVFGRNLS